MTEVPASRAPIEYRTAEVVDVQPSERLVDLIVMPYGRPALVPHNGRMIEEICERGAFTWGEATRVNRDHRLDRTVGAAEAFDADNPLGLAATLRIARTPLGDETLELAGAGCLDGSAGFRPLESTWERGEAVPRRRRLLRAFLAHIALTPEPAYVSARVLAVREAGHPEAEVVAVAPGPAAIATPRLDVVRGWDLTREAGLD